MQRAAAFVFPLPHIRAKEKKKHLCGLCVSSAAGGEKNKQGLFINASCG
jgi:hypothetical protein